MIRAESVSGYIALARPANGLIAAAAVLVGALMSGSLHPSGGLALACLSAMLIAGGGNALNDVYDIEVDAFNRPDRPLPSGRVGRHSAALFAGVLLVGGLTLSFTVSLQAFLLVIGVAFLLIIYSARLKRTALWGNLAVSASAAAAFVYGGLAVGRMTGALIPAGFAFLFHLGREIMKDVEDEAGDKRVGSRTLPRVVGRPAALRVAALVFGALIAATILPFLFGVYGLSYLLMVIAGVDAVLIYVLFRLWFDPGRAALGRLSTLLKADMVVALLVLYFGAR